MKVDIYTDGATRPTNPGPSGYGVAVYLDEDYNTPVDSLQGYLGSPVTNNQAEYMAMLVALTKLREMWLPKETMVFIHSDSKLVIEQLSGNWQVKSDKVRRIYHKTLHELGLARTRCPVFLHHVRGHQGIVGNERADSLAGDAVEHRRLPKMEYQKLFKAATGLDVVCRVKGDSEDNAPVKV